MCTWLVSFEKHYAWLHPQQNMKFFFLVCLIFHVMYFPTLIPDVGENNRYCSDNGPGVGSVERVSNKIMLGRKVMLCLSDSYYKYWMWIIFMFVILFCVTCVVLLKDLAVFRLLKRLYSRGPRCFIKLRFRALCRVALIATNSLCLFRLPVSVFHAVIVPYLEQGKFQVFAFLYTAGALHSFNRLLLCISFCPVTILTPRVESSHGVTITPAFCNKSDISSEWATRIWQKKKHFSAACTFSVGGLWDRFRQGLQAVTVWYKTYDRIIKVKYFKVFYWLKKI